jgi:RNA polymerase sigma-70 factor (ECF subfamily)
LTHGSDRDAEMLPRFAAGETEAFRFLYERHMPALWLMALRLTGANSAAEDLAQEVWVRAAGAAARFRGGSSVRTWLISILVNTFREQRRIDARESFEVLEESAPQAEPSLDLERAILRLPSGGREIFLLHDLEGYTHEEIGAILGIDAGTSRSQLSRARARIRESLNRGVAHERT